eukprot:SM000081S22684  [mRNA]  locus=s81:598316:601630:- [translate_table: standard]
MAEAAAAPTGPTIASAGAVPRSMSRAPGSSAEIVRKRTVGLVAGVGPPSHGLDVVVVVVAVARAGGSQMPDEWRRDEDGAAPASAAAPELAGDRPPLPRPSSLVDWELLSFSEAASPPAEEETGDVYELEEPHQQPLMDIAADSMMSAGGLEDSLLDAHYFASNHKLTMPLPSPRGGGVVLPNLTPVPSSASLLGTSDGGSGGSGGSVGGNDATAAAAHGGGGNDVPDMVTTWQRGVGGVDDELLFPASVTDDSASAANTGAGGLLPLTTATPPQTLPPACRPKSPLHPFSVGGGFSSILDDEPGGGGVESLMTLGSKKSVRGAAAHLGFSTYLGESLGEEVWRMPGMHGHGYGGALGLAAFQPDAVLGSGGIGGAGGGGLRGLDGGGVDSGHVLRLGSSPPVAPAAVQKVIDARQRLAAAAAADQGSVSLAPSHQRALRGLGGSGGGGDAAQVQASPVSALHAEDCCTHAALAGLAACPSCSLGSSYSLVAGASPGTGFAGLHRRFYQGSFGYTAKPLEEEKQDHDDSSRWSLGGGSAGIGSLGSSFSDADEGAESVNAEDMNAAAVFGSGKGESVGGSGVAAEAVKQSSQPPAATPDSHKQISGLRAVTGDKGAEKRKLAGAKSTAAWPLCEAWWSRKTLLLVRRLQALVEGQATAIWSVALTAAVMTLMLLAQRWHRERIVARDLRLQLAKRDERIGQLMLQVARLKEALSARKKVPILRASASYGNLV